MNLNEDMMCVTMASKRWAAGAGDDSAFQALYGLRTQLELMWLLDLEGLANAHEGLSISGTPLAWLEDVAQLPLRCIASAVTHPIATVWRRRTEEALRGQDTKRMESLLDAFAPIGAAAIALGGASAPACEVNLPERFTLPSLGVAVVRDHLGPVRVEVCDGSVVIQDGVDRLVIDPSGRRKGPDIATLRVEYTTRLEGFSAWLEAFDPSLRGLFPWVEVGPPDIPEWTSRLERSACLLQEVHPDLHAELFKNVRAFVPTSPGLTALHSTGSSRDAWGAVNTTLVDDPWLTDGIIHEHRHDLLNSLSHVVQIFADNAPVAEENLYSPWRSEPRHIVGVFHAVFVFTAVADFYVRLLSQGAGDFDASRERIIHDLGLQSVRLQLGIRELEKAGGMAEFGREVLDGLTEEARRLHEEAEKVGAFAGGAVSCEIMAHYRRWSDRWQRRALGDASEGVIWDT